MSFEDFEYLLHKIEPIISKKDTKWRKAIPAKERLALTLRFLASGDSYKSLQYLFKISPQLISKIVPEVCNAIIKEMKNSIKVRNFLFSNFEKNGKLTKTIHKIINRN